MTKRLLPLLSLLLFLLPACMSPEARLQQGDVYFQRGQYAYALRSYQSARADNPDLPDIDRKIHNAQVRVYFAQGDRFVRAARWDAARRSYEEVRRLEPDNTEVDERLAQLQVARAEHHFARGQQLMKRGNPFDAIGEFEQVLVYQPTHPRARRALELARQRKDQQERRAETYYRDGVDALRRRLYEDAMRNFAQAVKLNPYHPSAALELRQVEATLVAKWIADGDAELTARRYDQALALYRKAFERSPKTPGLVSRIDQAEREKRVAVIIAEGDRCLIGRRWKQALDRFNEARGLTSMPEALSDRLEQARNGFANEVYSDALAAQNAGRYEEALAGFASLIEIYPTFRDVSIQYKNLKIHLIQAETFYSTGCSAQTEGNLVVARDQLLACARVLSAYRDAATRLTEIEGTLAVADRLYKRGKKSELQRDFSRATMLYEECLALARPYRDVGDRLIGMRKLTRPKITMPNYEAALTALSKRDLRRARSLLETCQKRHPGHADTVKRLGEINAALRTAETWFDKGRKAESRGQLELARGWYIKTLSICFPYRDSKSRIADIDATLADLRLAQRYDHAKQIRAARKHYQSVLKRHAMGLAKQRVQEIDRIMTTLDREYAEMTTVANKGRHRRALGLAIGIHNKCRDYKDLSTKIPALENEADYDEGEALVAQGRNEEALKSFERCSRRNPHFKNVQKRMKDLRKKKHRAKPGR